MNRELAIGFLGAVVIHGVAMLGSVPVSKPHYEVVVAPTDLEVTLIYTKPINSSIKQKTPVPIRQKFIPKEEVLKPLPTPITIEQQILLQKKLEPEFEVQEMVKEFFDDIKLKDAKVDELLEENVEEPVIEESINDVETAKMIEKFRREEKEIKVDPEEPMPNVIRGAIMDIKPLTHFNKPPPYPRQARRRNWEGLVVLNVLVAKDGTVKSITTHTASGYSLLDDVAKKAVLQWRFTPAHLFGKPIEQKIKIPIRFQLDDRGDRNWTP